MTSRMVFFLALPLALVGAAPGWGAETSLDPGALEQRIAAAPSVADLVARAYQANPEILAARQKWRATVERYRVVTAYPDPQVMVTWFPKPIETRLGPQDWNAAISQVIPFPGRLSKAGELVEADAEIARLGLDKAVRDVVVALRESIHELGYIRKAQRVVSVNQNLVDHLRKTAETAHADDRAAFVDVAKAQSQVAQLRYDALLLAELDETERTRVNSLLNRPPDAPIGPIVLPARAPLAYELSEIYRTAETHQEEILMADARVAKAESTVELAHYQNLPNFKLGLFYAGVGDPDVPDAMKPDNAGDDALGIQFGMTVPLWFGKNAGRTESARAALATAQALKVGRVNETRAKIRALYFRLHNAERLIQLYGTDLLPQAAHAMEVAETWFQEGQGSFSDFVETESTYYNFQLSLARAEADYGKYLARLERMTGTSLTLRDGSVGEEGQ